MSQTGNRARWRGGGEVITVDREEEMAMIRVWRDCKNELVGWDGELIFADEKI